MNWLIAGCHCCLGGFVFHVMGGGSSSPSRLTDNDRFEDSPDSWSSQTDLPSPARRLHGTVNIDGTAYNFCGQTSGLSKDNDSYVLDSWTAKTDAPTAKADILWGVIGSYGYAIAGYTGVYLDENAEYDPSGNSWTTKAVMPSPARRTLATCFSADDGVFVTLGQGASSQLTDNDKYESAGDSWTAKTDAPSAKYGAGGMAIGAKGYTIGGTTAIAGTATVTEYDTAGDSWSTVAAIGYSSTHNRGAGFDGFGFVCGGSASGTFLDDNQKYDQSGDSWSVKSDMPSPTRYQANAVALA